MDKTLRVLEKCEEGTIAVTQYSTSKGKMILRCAKGHEREVTPGKLIGIGEKTHCKICGTKPHALRKTDEAFIGLCDKYQLTPLEKYVNNHTRVRVRARCGHEYTISPNSLGTKGSGSICRVCHPVGVRSSKEVAQLLEGRGVTLVGTYINGSTRVDVRGSCGHVYSVEPDSVILKGVGYLCKICENPNRKSVEDVEKVLSDKNLTLVGKYLGAKENIVARHNECGHLFTALGTNLLYKEEVGLKCSTCYPINTSAGEIELLEYIKSIYSGWVVHGDRSILGGKELDIVLPDLGIAIEYNGEYWHRETELRGKNYHLDKLKGVEAIDFRLISIMETEWRSLKDIVKSKIASIITKDSFRLGGRNTVVREIPFPAEFLRANHLQGEGAPTSINYGLFYKEELVSVMTFGLSRYSNICEYELIRYCTLLDVRVVGGASKLLSYFLRKFPGVSLLSYSDKRWSTGEVYGRLGFSLHHSSLPGYKYYKGGKVLSRYKCQKHLLPALVPEHYREELSESEIMANAGYSKVYDCGNDVWVLK